MQSTYDPIPALQKLLETKLETFEKVELVLLLHGSSEPVALSDAARELQIGPDVLRRVALEVQRSRVLEITGDDRLQLTATPAELEAIGRADELYRHDRQRLIEELSSIAMRRLRSMAARTFANAFRIRKKEDADG